MRDVTRWTILPYEQPWWGDHRLHEHTDESGAFFRHIHEGSFTYHDGVKSHDHSDYTTTKYVNIDTSGNQPPKHGGV